MLLLGSIIQKNNVPLTCMSISFEKGENALASGELTEAANGEHEMEVLLIWTHFQREPLFSKCQSFQLTITYEKAEPNTNALAAAILQMSLQCIVSCIFYVCVCLSELFPWNFSFISNCLLKPSKIFLQSQQIQIGYVFKAAM